MVEGAAGWKKHVAEASQMLANPRTKLGRPPADLAEVVAQVALAGPAVTALRAIARITGGAETATDPLRRHMAGKVAFGFHSLFNAADVIALIRGQNGDEPYWRRALEYCVAGCLQAVLDEYVHVLRESLGDAEAEPPRLATDVGNEIAAALNLRSASPGADKISIDAATSQLSLRIEASGRGLRCASEMRRMFTERSHEPIRSAKLSIRHFGPSCSRRRPWARKGSTSIHIVMQ